MAKTSKKALGAAMAGVMAVGAVAGAAGAVQEVKAGVAEDVKLIHAKIEHFRTSLKKNYLGLKNVGQWQAYEKEIKALIAKLPAGSSQDKYQARLDVCVSLLNAAAKVNHVEKSLVDNFNGIKNAETWSVYLKDGQDLLGKVDKEFEGRKAELVERLAKAKTTVDGIIKKHEADLAAATKLFEEAKKSMKAEDAEKALKAAEALGTHASSDKLKNEIKAYVALLNEKLEVTTVSAPNSKALYVVGAGLNKLVAGDITVAGNKVTSVKVAEDMKSATISLETELAPNTETNVSIKVGDATKEFKVANGFVVNSVAVVEKSYDDDRADQKLSIKVNGQDVTVDYLNLAGYTVNFVAKDKDNKAANIFAGSPATNVSNSGKLVAGIIKDNYTVEVQVTKAGSILVSNSGVINVVNLDAATTSIDEVLFANGNASHINYNDGDDTDNTELTNTVIGMNSTTLVAGETAEIYSVKATINGDKKLVASNGFKVETSNSGVISVDKTTNVITAEAAGTAVITVKVGDVTKTYNFTVTNEKRTLSSVKLAKPSLKAVTGTTAKVKVNTYDQYGDPIAVATGDIEEVLPKNAANVDLVSSVDVVTSVNSSTDVIGEAILTMSVDQVGTGTVYLKDKFINPNTGKASEKTLASLYLDITDVKNITSRKIELVNLTGQSTDNTLEKTDANDNTVSFKLANYNPSGVYVSAQALVLSTKAMPATPAAGEFTVESLDETVATIALDTTKTLITATAVSKGSTDIVIKDDKGVVVAKATVTVNNSPYNITNVAFKSVGKIDYEGKQIELRDVLDIEVSDKDDVVKGITLNKTTSSAIRIVETDPSSTSVATDTLYIDINNNGNIDSGDIVLGAVAAFAGSDAEGTLSGLVNASASGYAANGIIKPATFTAKGTVLIKVMGKDSTGAVNVADPSTAVKAISIVYDVVKGIPSPNVTFGTATVVGKVLLSGTTVAMEYSTNNGTSWTPCTPNIEIAANAGDKILVRFAAAAPAPASEIRTLIVGLSNIATAAPLISGHSVAQGTAVGNTAITYTAGAGNTLATKVQAGVFTTPLVGTTPTGTTAYTSGNDLAVTAGQHVGLYELNSAGKVVKFIDLTIAAGDIK
ncbi:MAG: hypothetical protein RR539_07860 [Clostridium sp.]|uniref:hypothetical protein n=2 Tax=Clostridium sp. TaxID=1506 RepID=UPI002FC6991B